ncbi:hypothetical protein NGG61_13370 [Enterococcus casseliflavus]|uniref:hypothetical protein n=1 Tax=Enterococcus casseliflavus TaxID=37734 RepID=UPI002DBED663|nr:hypothetical protein [Enterococcus casseliflavus]MEB8400912.1 hypothetical protein [Enterococcus casseliflavus]
MRYNDEITFVIQRTRDVYDPDTGNWIPGTTEKKTVCANVTDLGLVRSVEIFGDIQQGAKVIRLQPLATMPTFEQIEFEGRIYELATHKQPAGRNTLIVKEVVQNGSRVSS